MDSNNLSTSHIDQELDIIIEYVSFGPNITILDIKDSKIINKILNVHNLTEYYDSYDFHCYNDRDTGYKLSEKEKQLLNEITTSRILTGTKFKYYDDFDSLFKTFSKYFKHPYFYSPGYFVRLSSNSAKHDFELYPLYNPIQVLDYLTKSKTFLDQEYTRIKDTYVFFIPWNPNITKRSEFRIFYYNKLTAISQQYHYLEFNYNDSEIKIIVESIKILVLNTQFPYNIFVADIWIDFNNKIANIIEYNPWGCSGSALFHYVDDYDLLHGIPNVTSLKSKPILLRLLRK